VANAALSRVGPTTEQLSDGIKPGTWTACTTRPSATSAGLLALAHLPSDRPDRRRSKIFSNFEHHGAHKETLGSAEDDSDEMCFPVIDEPDAEITVEGDAIDLH